MPQVVRWFIDPDVFDVKSPDMASGKPVTLDKQNPPHKRRTKRS